MNEQMPAYGLWSLVLINSAVFILFAFSFFKPRTDRDWRSFGAFSAFVVALLTAMFCAGCALEVETFILPTSIVRTAPS